MTAVLGGSAASCSPSETLPGETLPGETLPNEILPSETLPNETPRSQAWQALQEVATGRSPVSLAEVMAEAALQTRVDRKFLLTPDQLLRLTDALGDGFRVLDIDDRRIFQYESVYFDTADFEQFRAHRQGRRRRYKVRSRTYADSGVCMFEVKLKGHRAETVKHRMPYRVEDRDRLSAEARSFLAGRLEEAYGMTLPGLEPVLRTDYSRGTLVDPVNQERLTCDVDLLCSDQRGSVLGPDLVVVETKTVNGRGLADQTLARMGIRPVTMSKYCLGIALLNPELPANRWNRLLRTHFEWERQGSS